MLQNKSQCPIFEALSFLCESLLRRLLSDPWLPTTRPRQANKNQHNFYSDLIVDSLIESASQTWNLHVIRTLVDLYDVKIIGSIPLSRTQMMDKERCHYTKNRKYTVKSEYQVEHVYPDKEPSFEYTENSTTYGGGRWCFTDGSWKENNIFSEQGWYSTLEGFDDLMGARNVRASLSPLHAEVEVLFWAMKCMRNLCQFKVTFATYCSIGEDGFRARRMTNFCKLFRRYQDSKGKFSQLRNHSCFKHEKCGKSSTSVRNQSFFVVYMDAELPIWFTESV